MDVAFMAAAALLAMGPAAAQDRETKSPATAAERQARCRQANDAMVHALRQSPPPGPRNEAALRSKVPALVAANRRKGVEECSTWEEVNRTALQR